eukprot:g10789.t1
MSSPTPSRSSSVSESREQAHHQMIPPLSSQQQPAQAEPHQHDNSGRHPLLTEAEGESGENLQEAVVQLQELLEQKDLQWDELFAQFKGFRSQTDREHAEYRQQTQELEHRVEELVSEAAALRKALFEKEKTEKELRRHRGQLEYLLPTGPFIPWAEVKGLELKREQIEVEKKILLSTLEGTNSSLKIEVERLKEEAASAETDRAEEVGSLRAEISALRAEIDKRDSLVEKDLKLSEKRRYWKGMLADPRRHSWLIEELTNLDRMSAGPSALEQRNKDNQPAAVGGAGSAAHQGSSGSSSDEDTYLAHLRSGAPPPVDQSAELEAATAQREQEMEKFGKMLPYRPRRRPFAMFKESCLSFVEDKAEKCGYNAERLHFFMPKCTWGAELCAVLLEKLKSVVAVMGAESAAGAGGAGSGMLGSGSAGAMGSVSEGAAAAAAPSGGSVGAMKMMAGGGAGSGSGVVLGSLMGSGGMEEDGPPKVWAAAASRARRMPGLAKLKPCARPVDSPPLRLSFRSSSRPRVLLLVLEVVRDLMAFPIDVARRARRLQDTNWARQVFR